MILKITLIGLMAGVLGTGLGGVLSGIFKKKVDKYIDFFMGLSGGIMLAVVVFDLMKEAIEQKGIFVTVSATFLGVVITMLIKENLHMSQDKQAGYLIFISILLHNLPEGLAIGSSFVSAETLGFTLAIVIGIHNVPEGLATALTLAGTKMKTSKIILYTVIAGIPMGIGSFLGVYFAGNFNSLIGVFLSIAAGTMLYVVLEEILPRTKNLFCIIGFLIGTIIVYSIKIKRGGIKMDTLISKIDVDNIDMEEIKKQAEILRAGETVIFPTETVYGLGANALDEEAVSKIYKAKGRPSDNPLIVHIGDKKQVYNLVQSVTKEAEIVMDKFWPGPITIILNKKDIIPKRTSGGLDTVAIRMPSNKIANALIKEANIPIAAPSANISGRPSPTRAKHVYEEMNHRVSGIIMGNDCVYGLESTVLDLTGEIPTILRPGSITKEQLEKELGNVQLDAALEKKEDNIKAKAPGMKYTHYSPNAEVYIVSGEQTNVIDKINTLIEENNDKNLKTCVICLKCNEKQYIGKTICLGETLEDVASNLFDALIQADEEKCDIIYSESFTNEGIGCAIMNRLLKSAGYKIIGA